MNCRLHVLNEFEKAADLVLKDVNKFETIFDEWEKRGQLLTTSRGQEFVLNMRRAFLNFARKLGDKRGERESASLKCEIGKLWLKSAKIARK